MLSELWSLAFLWKPPPLTPLFAYSPLLNFLCFSLFSLSPIHLLSLLYLSLPLSLSSLTSLPHLIFAQSHEWAGLSLVWHHSVFPMHLPHSCSDVRQISLQWACSHCLYSLIDAGMLEVTHESKSAFHAYSWHPIEATHCVCVWVWSPAPCGPVLVLPCFNSSFALTHRVLFWNADII